MGYYVYILECEDETLYTGIARDVEKRFEVHRRGKGAAYTRVHIPRRIVYRCKFETKNEALREEYRIKQLKRSQKLQLFKEIVKL